MVINTVKQGQTILGHITTVYMSRVVLHTLSSPVNANTVAVSAYRDWSEICDTSLPKCHSTASMKSICAAHEWHIQQPIKDGRAGSWCGRHLPDAASARGNLPSKEWLTLPGWPRRSLHRHLFLRYFPLLHYGLSLHGNLLGVGYVAGRVAVSEHLWPACKAGAV